MTRPVSILADARGMARDHAIDNMPGGFVWDLADYLPDRRGAKLESRGAWSYFSTPAFVGSPWGGKHAAFRRGTKLLIAGTGGNLYDVNEQTGVSTLVGTLFSSGLQNGVLLRDRVYFPDGSGGVVPKAITFDGTTLTIGNCHSSAPKATLAAVYKERLV